MPYRVLEYEKQTRTLIANGIIEENKPIGLVHDNKSIRPYSNIFLLSRIWTDVGGDIPEHPHKGFEILTYVLKGSLEHYNPNSKKWIKVNSGDFELLKSGSGINQAVKVQRNSEVIQVWFDPDIRQSLTNEYVWETFESNSCKQFELPGKTIKTLIDEDSNAQLVSESVKVYDYKLTPGPSSFKFKEDRFYTLYLIKGELEVEGKFINENSLIIIKDETLFEFFVSIHTRLLFIESPLKTKYKTYLQLKSEGNS